jgi:hypothetical protein
MGKNTAKKARRNSETRHHQAEDFTLRPDSQHRAFAFILLLVLAEIPRMGTRQVSFESPENTRQTKPKQAKRRPLSQLKIFQEQHDRVEPQDGSVMVRLRVSLHPVVFGQ